MQFVDIMDVVTCSWADTWGSQQQQTQTSIFFQDQISESLLSNNQKIFRHSSESARGKEINMRGDGQVYILWLEFVKGIYINSLFRAISVKASADAVTQTQELRRTLRDNQVKGLTLGLTLTLMSAVFRFTRTEIKYLYRVFKAECPNGILTEEMFHKIFSAFFPWGAEPYQSKLLQFHKDKKRLLALSVSHFLNVRNYFCLVVVTTKSFKYTYVCNV